MKRDVVWQKSSYSGGGDGANCVEVAGVERAIALRESDEPREVVVVGRAAFDALRHVLASGRFDEHCS
ncbi:DUF397 domain-containing protein [Streptomyces sp. NPDC003077]|uniref:DUF397 domain-containing protein n=1 Tax=Streptomyces sp. NPDC003077 TaxID=3154443 RepID=UPI0033B10D5B